MSETRGDIIRKLIALLIGAAAIVIGYMLLPTYK